MITATLPRYFSSGPIKPKNGITESSDKCDQSWWYNLLYVSNIFIADPNVESTVSVSLTA